MSLVQTLTGRNSLDRDHTVVPSLNDSSSSDFDSSCKMLSSPKSSSLLISSSPTMDLNQSKSVSCMSDIPLYTPTGLDLFYSGSHCLNSMYTPLVLSFVH